jgi:hypothetical protein
MATPPTRPKLSFEGGGWVGYTQPGKRYGTRIHLSHKPGPGRWVVDEVRFVDFRVTARDLRDFPLGKIEAWVNHLAQQGLVDPIEGKVSGAVQFPSTGVAGWIPGPPEAPTKGPKPDEFYRQFGEIYGKAAGASTQPAKDLAEAWEVPVTTVHRWIREARRRGHLPPAEQGRRG